MKITAIYDNGGKTLDRYTVMTDELFTSLRHSFMALGMDHEGRGYSQWGEAQPGRHLGKRVKFEDLDEATQKHIAERVLS
jgi:hypothetical protein